MDNGKIFRMNANSGVQVPCDSRGVDIKPFNPKITGRYNYDDRNAAVIKNEADFSPVELPLTLKPNFKRNYVPQNQRLDGYAQMPRMIAPPYSNQKLVTQVDAVRKRRARVANQSIQRERLNASLPQSLANAGGSIMSLSSPRRTSDFKVAQISNTPGQKREESSMKMDATAMSSFRNSLDQDATA